MTTYFRNLATATSAANTLTGAEVIPVIQDGATVHATLDDVVALTLTNPTFTGALTEQVATITDGASVVLSPANGTVQTWTLGANRSPTASFLSGQYMTLMISDAGGYTVTWPSVTWVGGAAPTLSNTGQNIIELWMISTTLYGALVGVA